MDDIRRYAERMRKSPGIDDRLLRTDKGKILAVLANAIIALRFAPMWDGVLAYNEFTGATIMRGCPPFELAGGEDVAWTNRDDALTAAWLQRNAIMVSSSVAAEAVETVAKDQSFHPVRNYLGGLRWDGKPRLEPWAIDHLGAEDGDYVRAVASRWLISAIARIYRPGIKADHCLILEGPQGILKSTALRTLASPWFTDEIGELGSKDAAMQLRGVWVMELAELDAITRAEVSRIKAFMSRNIDHYRPPYGRRVVDVPRQCVFAGTANKETYLRDETGGRRFWPIVCGTINIEGLKAMRDQLWAEALVRFRAGDPWWLERAPLIETAAEEQDARYTSDTWEEKISEHLAQLVTNAAAYDLAETTVNEILSTVLLVPLERQEQRHANRVVAILQRLGWGQVRARHGDGTRPRVYRPRSGMGPRKSG
jgi:predicted P-loop ATPase